MFYRLQTYYLAAVIIIQSIAALGVEFFRFKVDKYTYVYNSWGVNKYAENGTFENVKSIAVFVGFIALALLSFLAIMAYRNVPRQFKLGRMVFFLYFISVLSIYLMSIFGDSITGSREVTREVGWAYWMYIAGFPLSFLANASIKRDKNLLDSLKRL